MTDRLLLIEANDDSRWVGSRVGPKVHVLPIALMGLAACARSLRPELSIRLVETSLDAPEDEALAQLVRDFDPTWIGIRSISLFIDEVRRVVAVCRRATRAPLLLGGPIATALGTQLFAQIDGLDYVATGEGEPVILGLVAGTALARIPGVSARSAATSTTQQIGSDSLERPRSAPPQRELDLRHAGEEPMKWPATLDDLPIASYDLVDLGRYARTLSYAYNQRRQGVLVTSRGCPFSCTYCFQISDRPVRLQSVSRVVHEIRTLHEQFGISDFYVVDDLFNLKRQRALAIFEHLIRAELGVRLYFVNGLRVDLCDEAFVERMIEAGTVWVTYAIESACPRIQALIKKTINLDHARRIINYTQSRGIVVNVNTMFGFPTETPAEAEVTLDYLGSLDHPSILPYHFNLRGYPGCKIVEQAEQSGWSRDAFLSTGFLSYGDWPLGSPTFSRHEMMQHLLQFHERYGLANRAHLDFSVRTLRRIGYRDPELVDMYTVLMNRHVTTVDELLDPVQDARGPHPA
jgi:anaerobic magnesium-protoporphyrin IX monomethyl ester cyclase